MADFKTNVVSNSNAHESDHGPTIHAARLREQDGAHASAFEVSPVRKDQANKVSFSRASSHTNDFVDMSQPQIMTRPEITTDFWEAKESKQTYKSPLKPSIDNQIEHLHYDKMNKTGFQASPVKMGVDSPESQQGRKQPAIPKIASKPAPVEEPKIISKSACEDKPEN
jgi:hypothetical protein